MSQVESAEVADRQLLNPFKGLDYFVEDDPFPFAGRDVETQEVLNGILRSRTFLLYGRSGLGKTSLVRAGIIPLLRDRGALPIYLRVLEDPLLDLSRALAAALPGGAPEAAEDPALLIRRLAGHPGGEPRLVTLIFDQFEEFFVRFADQLPAGSSLRAKAEPSREERLRRRELRQKFIERIGALANDQDLNLRIVFSLREDWLAEMKDFAPAIPQITAHGFRLQALSSFGVRQAVVATLRKAGLGFEAPLVSNLVETLADVQFDPAVLQVVCSEVWQAAIARPGAGPLVLTADDLAATGSVVEIFERYVDQLAAKLQDRAPSFRILTWALLESLISEQRTKWTVRRDDLLEQSFVIAPEELDRILDLLEEQKLIRFDRSLSWVELIHERLIAVVLDYLGIRNGEYIRYQSARNLVVTLCRATNWRDDPSQLMNPGQLDNSVGRFKDLLRFAPEEYRFLAASALTGPSADVEFWTRKAGKEISIELARLYLEHPDPGLRARVAAAVTRLGEGGDLFISPNLEMALTDSDPEARRTAARSFWAKAGAADVAPLRQALQAKDKEKRKRAQEVLVEGLAQERPLRDWGFGRFQIWQASRALDKRRLDEGRALIAEESLAGAVAGFKSGGWWALFASWLIVYPLVFEFMEYKHPGLVDFLVLLGSFAALALLWGLFLGWHTARRLAREAVKRRPLRLISPLVGGWVLWTHLSICVVVLGIWLNENGTEMELAKLVSFTSLVLFLAGLMVLPILAAWLASLLLRIGDRRSPTARLAAYFGSFCGAAGLAWLLWALGGWSRDRLSAWWTAPERFSSTAEQIRVSFFGLATFQLVLGGLSAYTVWSVARLADQPPGGTLPLLGRSGRASSMARPWISRFVGGLALLAILTGVFHFGLRFGFDGLPGGAHRWVVAPGSVVKKAVPVTGSGAGIYYAEIVLERGGDTGPALVQVVAPGSARVFAQDGKEFSGRWLVLFPGDSLPLTVHQGDEETLLEISAASSSASLADHAISRLVWDGHAWRGRPPRWTDVLFGMGVASFAHTEDALARPPTQLSVLVAQPADQRFLSLALKTHPREIDSGAYQESLEPIGAEWPALHAWPVQQAVLARLEPMDEGRIHPVAGSEFQILTARHTGQDGGLSHVDLWHVDLRGAADSAAGAAKATRSEANLPIFDRQLEVLWNRLQSSAGEPVKGADPLILTGETLRGLNPTGIFYGFPGSLACSGNLRTCARVTGPREFIVESLTGGPEVLYRGTTKDEIWSLAGNPDLSTVYVGSGAGRIEAWDWRNDAKVLFAELPKPASSWGGQDRQLWCSETGRYLIAHELGINWVYPIVAGRGGKPYGFEFGSYGVFDFSSDRPVLSEGSGPTRILPPGGSGQELTVHPEGNVYRAWITARGTKVVTLSQDFSNISSLEETPQEVSIVGIWDLQDESRSLMLVQDEPVADVYVAPDGGPILTLTKSGRLVSWSTAPAPARPDLFLFFQKN